MDEFILCIIAGALVSIAWSLDNIKDIFEKKK